MQVKIEGLKLTMEATTIAEASVVSDLYTKYLKSTIKEPVSLGGVTFYELQKKKKNKTRKVYNRDKRLLRCDFCGKVCRGRIGIARHIGSSDHKDSGHSVVNDIKPTVVAGAETEPVTVIKTFF